MNARWGGMHWAGGSMTHSTDQSRFYRVSQQLQNGLISLSRTTLPAAPPTRLLWRLRDNMAPFQTQQAVSYETQGLCVDDNPGYGLRTI